MTDSGETQDAQPHRWWRRWTTNRWIGSVRLRVTLMAATVIAITALGGSVLLLRSLEDRLIADVRRTDAAALERQAGNALRVAVGDDATAASERTGGVSVSIGEEGAVVISYGSSAGNLDPDSMATVLSQQIVGVDGVAMATGNIDIDQALSASVGRGAFADSQVLVSSLDLADGTTIATASSLDPIRNSLDETRTLLWLAGPGLVVIVAALAWIMVGRALRPVHALTSQVAAISATSLDERVPIPTQRDEINELARTMNSMLDRLETATITNRQLVSDASHELRTPVAVILNELAIAERQPDDDPQHLRAAVAREAERLHRLVDDLLLLNKLAEQPDAATSVVSAADIARDVAGRRRRVPVHVHHDLDADYLIHGDETALTRALDHLVTNATRHARRHVDVRLSRTTVHVRLDIDDDGPGVPYADRTRVLQRFVRLDEARTRDAGGAGLGLTVAHDVITTHHGTLDITDSPNGGARVTVTIPIADTYT